jgi:large subunit ribosomal protein L18
MNTANVKTIRRNARHKSILSKMRGTAECPRLKIRRSLKHMYICLINDQINLVLLNFSSKTLGLIGKKSEVSYKLGMDAGQKIMEMGITRICFDRGGFLYHGRVKAVADGLRKAGLQF